MQAVKGYLTNGWFTPVDKVKLPNHIEAVLVFGDKIETLQPENEHALNEPEMKACIDWLNQVKASLELSRDEDLTNFPKQGLMQTNYDDWVD